MSGLIEYLQSRTLDDIITEDEDFDAYTDGAQLFLLIISNNHAADNISRVGLTKFIT